VAIRPLGSKRLGWLQTTLSDRVDGDRAGGHFRLFPLCHGSASSVPQKLQQPRWLSLLNSHQTPPERESGVTGRRPICAGKRVALRSNTAFMVGGNKQKPRMASLLHNGNFQNPVYKRFVRTGILLLASLFLGESYLYLIIFPGSFRDADFRDQLPGFCYLVRTMDKDAQRREAVHRM